MGNEITSTHDLAEADWDGSSEPSEVDSDIVATKEAEGKGIEFHVSMRDYTMADMEALIVEAAARMLVGRHNDAALAKQIEAKCIELVADRAERALASVTAEIIDQPLLPKFTYSKPDDKPVTMRDFIGLTGQAFLTAKVGTNGEPTTDTWHSKPRIQYLAEKFMDAKFKKEIEAATSAAIREIQSHVAAMHKAVLDAEKARIRDAIAKATTA